MYKENQVGSDTTGETKHVHRSGASPHCIPCQTGSNMQYITGGCGQVQQGSRDTDDRMFEQNTHQTGHLKSEENDD